MCLSVGDVALAFLAVDGDTIRAMMSLGVQCIVSPFVAALASDLRYERLGALCVVIPFFVAPASDGAHLLYTGCVCVQ